MKEVKVRSIEFDDFYGEYVEKAEVTMGSRCGMPIVKISPASYVPPDGAITLTRAELEQLLEAMDRLRK